MKQVAGILAIALVLAWCSDTYTQYHEAKTSSQSLQNSGDIPSIAHEVLVNPDDRLNWEIVRKIRDADTRVWLNVYILTHASIIQALIDARNRGVDVRVLLERSVFQYPRVNNPAYERLTKEGISVTWASEKDFNFNHAKYLLIDQSFVLGTGNMTKSSLEKNREFFIVSEDTEIVAFLEKLFEADVKRIPYKESRPWILLSPLDSREKVTQLIQDAKRSIRFFSASLSDSEILNLLEQKARWGVTVEICLTEAKNSERTRLIERFKPLWIFVKQAKKPYVHAKSLLIDDSILLIWSMNFTQNSIDNNREVGLILNKSAFLPEYRQIVSRDCSG